MKMMMVLQAKTSRDRNAKLPIPETAQ